MAGKFTQGTAKWTGLFNGTCRSTVEGKYRIRKKKLLYEPHNKAAVFQLCNTEKQWDNSINEPPILQWQNKTKQMAFGTQTKDGQRRHMKYFNWGGGVGGVAENYQLTLNPFKNVYINGPRATCLRN